MWTQLNDNCQLRIFVFLILIQQILELTFLSMQMLLVWSLTEIDVNEPDKVRFSIFFFSLSWRMFIVLFQQLGSSGAFSPPHPLLPTPFQRDLTTCMFPFPAWDAHPEKESESVYVKLWRAHTVQYRFCPESGKSRNTCCFMMVDWLTACHNV